MLAKPAIEELLIGVENDDALWEPPALVDINAPLALIQVYQKAKSDLLRQILELPPRPKKRPANP